MSLSTNAQKAIKNALADKDLGAEVAAAIDSNGSGPAANVADITSSNLVGVDGTGSNAAPLAGTETRLDAIEAKINDILAALQAAGMMS
jgi:hypothetical protein